MIDFLVFRLLFFTNRKNLKIKKRNNEIQADKQDCEK